MNLGDRRTEGRPFGRAHGRCTTFLALLAGLVLANATADARAGEIRLTGVPVPGTHCYRMTTDFVTIEPDGRRHRPDVYELWAEYAVPPDGDVTVTCRRFALRQGDSTTVVIPALRDWSYRSRITPTGLDEHGWIFGIDQAKFASLTDDRGAALPPGNAYCVFNAFVDLAGFSEVFVRRADGGGIQDLRHAGERIVHAASHRDAPISLGDFVAEGSSFRLGEVTLDLKGTGEVDGRRCALIGYDSGDGSLTMTLKPAPQVVLETRGSSHFFGDLYVDLATQSLRKATLAELIVSETSGSVLPRRISATTERRLVLRELSREEFERALGPGDR